MEIWKLIKYHKKTKLNFGGWLLGTGKPEICNTNLEKQAIISLQGMSGFKV